MESIYAGRVENGVVVECIVGTAEWAIENLGGEWYDSPLKVWIGGTWNNKDGFRPPQPFPDCWWGNNQWVCPEPEFVDDSV
jgi:hypothetical protein